MTVKLNLTIEEATAKKAKLFAEKHKLSISKLVNDYLDNLTSEKKLKSKLGFASKYAGIIKEPIEDIKIAKKEILSKKYGY